MSLLSEKGSVIRNTLAQNKNTIRFSVSHIHVHEQEQQYMSGFLTRSVVDPTIVITLSRICISRYR